MPWHNLAFAMAGLIGATVAVMHGVIVQRRLVEPLTLAAADSKMSATVRRLIAPLLHFSTVVWFAGGVALVCAPWLNGPARLCVGIMVAVKYLFGALGNFWATRGWHPGWILMVVALMLIAFGATAPSLLT